MDINPLQRYFRQPKLYISLPSKGQFYAPGVLQGDHSNVPILAMTGVDEIIMKTPDALFNGEATIKLIESCCPYIKNAKLIPNLDVDVLLASIRAATFGDTINVVKTCGNCGTENEFDIKIGSIIDHYTSRSFNGKLPIGDLTINLKPLTYSETTHASIENFKLQKTLKQLDGMDSDQQRAHLGLIYDSLSKVQVDIIVQSIESIQTPEALVTDEGFIRDWLTNSMRDTYSIIKTKLEENKKEWEMPKFPIKCSECGTDDQLDVTLDQSNFFE